MFPLRKCRDGDREKVLRRIGGFSLKEFDGASVAYGWGLERLLMYGIDMHIER